MNDNEKKIVMIIREMSKKSKDIDDEELLNMKFLDEGLIDSFQIIEMITRIEEVFGIRLSTDKITSRDFRTLKGVAKIVEELQGM
jgi:acyl carrier protein